MNSLVIDALRVGYGKEDRSFEQMLGRTKRLPPFPSLALMQFDVQGSRKRGRHTSNLWAARLACALQARGQGPLPYKAKP